MPDEQVRFQAEVIITLHCSRCQATHEFPSADFERIVYSLQALVSDLRDHVGCTNSGSSTAFGTPCLNDMLSSSNNDDDYRDFVEAMIAAREES